jgi:O-antigen ligase
MIFEKSNSRNSIAAIAVYIFVVNLMPNKLLIKNLINKSIFLFLTVGSLVWTKIVIYLYQHLILIKLFFSNKHFYTGREIIWDEVWDLLKSSWLFGLGTHQSLSSITTFNLHNSMLNLLSAYGLLTAVAFIMLAYAVFKNMVNRLEKYNDRFSKISLAAYITIMFHAFNELTLFSTTFLAPMLALFSFLADYGDDLKAIKQIKCCNIATYKLLLKPDASVKKKYKQGLENYT